MNILLKEAKTKLIKETDWQAIAKQNDFEHFHLYMAVIIYEAISVNSIELNPIAYNNLVKEIREGVNLRYSKSQSIRKLSKQLYNFAFKKGN